MSPYAVPAFQSAYAHESDQSEPFFTGFGDVSIHAPARGDASDKRNRFHNAVSIHTQEIYNDLDGEVVFQSTPREGTTAATIATAPLTQFRSMSPRDEAQTPFMTMTKQFQSTRTARARPSEASTITRAFLFQSARPCGARLAGFALNPKARLVSIHAPAQGHDTTAQR